jgi:hypothetical protein
MKALRPGSICCLLVGLLAVAAPFSPRAQSPFYYPPPPPIPPPTNPTAQRNALNAVRAQANWVRNAIRTASSYASGGYGVVWQQFQILRQTYTSFKATLTAGQLKAGANELAELDAGLDILQQAFDEYQQDVAAGRSQAKAFQSLCQALDKGAVLWLEELNKTTRRLGI